MLRVRNNIITVFKKPRDCFLWCADVLLLKGLGESWVVLSWGAQSFSSSSSLVTNKKERKICDCVKLLTIDQQQISKMNLLK